MKLHDLPQMTVTQHHALAVGVLVCCYDHVPRELQQAIAEGLEAAKAMGMDIHPELVTRPAAQLPHSALRTPH